MFPESLLRMKRLSTVLAASAAIVTLHGQVITSVQDGAWSDPATWDCNCVPPVPAEMVVMHNVNLSGGLNFSPSRSPSWPPGRPLHRSAPVTSTPKAR